MGLVDDQEDGFSGLLFGVQEGFLDLEVDGAFGESGGQAQEPVEMIQEIGPAESGQGGVDGPEEVLIEPVHIGTQGQGFAHPGIAGEQQDAAPTLDVFQTGEALFQRFGFEEFLGFQVLVERETLEAEPGQEVLHDRTFFL